jgi:TolB-like protein/class 3 adenylate cyclase
LATEQDQPARVGRRLAAIVAADVAGYSRLMSLDEVGTARTLREHRVVTDALVARHGGRLVKTTGHGVLLEFPSVVDAVECAIAVQAVMAERNAEVPADRRMLFRIGVNLGDILIEGDDILGDGVNIAARLEGIADPGGICVSSSAYDQVRGKVAVEFSDLGEQKLKNIDRPMRAYSVIRDGIGSQLAPRKAQQPALDDQSKPRVVPNKPSIAVLPFQNISGDPEQEYFADGVVEDIITQLSHFKSLFVIARNSTFTYKGKAVDIKQVGEELGVRYVLEGSVRKAGSRLRITGQLIEAQTNRHLWADKFDGALEDVFDLQDRITTRVVGLIAPQIERAEIERAKQKPTASLDGHDFYLRGMALIHKYNFSNETQAFFQKAHQLDPEFAAAYAMDAFVLLNQHTMLGRSLSEEKQAEALRLAETAAELANDDALALARAAHVLAYFGRQYDRAMQIADRAVSLNPNSSPAWHSRGWIAINCCKPDQAIESFSQSIRFNPKDPGILAAWVGTSYALWMKGKYEEGFVLASKAIQIRATLLSLGAYIVNAVAAGHLDQAREAVKQTLAMVPDRTISKVINKEVAFSDPSMTSRLAECLRDAGFPE